MVLEQYKNFIENAINFFQKDERFLGIAAAGSYITKDMDTFSDIDLVIVVKPEVFNVILKERIDIANKLGDLLSAFTGEHVGEPRLLICLYNNPLLHVDLKFVSYNDIAHRVEEFVILWERNNLITEKIKEEEAEFPNPDLQWIEDRFWVWVHYISGKIGRGELFEAIDVVSFFRQTVIGPLLLMYKGKQPRGVRKIEVDASEYLEALKGTIASYDKGSIYQSTKIIIEIYREMRDRLKTENLVCRVEAEKEAIKYLDSIGRLLNGNSDT